MLFYEFFLSSHCPEFKTYNHNVHKIYCYCDITVFSRLTVVWPGLYTFCGNTKRINRRSK